MERLIAYILTLNPEQVKKLIDHIEEIKNAINND